MAVVLGPFQALVEPRITPVALVLVEQWVWDQTALGGSLKRVKSVIRQCRCRQNVFLGPFQALVEPRITPVALLLSVQLMRDQTALGGSLKRVKSMIRKRRCRQNDPNQSMEGAVASPPSHR